MYNKKIADKIVHNVLGTKHKRRETYLEVYEKLAESNTSTPKDEIMVQHSLQTIFKFPKARVVGGVVYPDGRGEPIPINTFAKIMLKALKR